jgi:hypothetical protein
VPTQAALQCIWGRGPEEIWIGGQDTAIFHYDGYAWVRMELPRGAFTSRLAGDDRGVYAAGGSRSGGEVFRLHQGTWARDEQLGAVPWLEGLWLGWGGRLAVAPRSGSAWVRDEHGWNPEPMPAEEIFTVCGGTRVRAIGRIGQYTAILARGEHGWDIETTLRGVQLRAIWSGGSAKPPRMSPPQPASDPELEDRERG